MGRLPYTYEHLDNLKEIGVVGMVSVVEPWEMPFKITEIQDSYGITVLLLPTPDYFSPTVPQIDEGIKFIDEQSKKGSVYLHCHAGKGRSAIVMIAYLCVKNGWSLADSFRYVRSKRPIANLALFFGIRPQWRALLAWHTSYQHHLLQSKNLQ
uniref:Uncharacterized protein n=1 Tax=Arcella intermedia TaxID=1963864 RepID=A0A6B2LNK4_9EUKA